MQVKNIDMERFYARKLLSSNFHRLGRSIGKHPSIYLCVSFSLALVQILGFIRFWHLTDMNELFFTETGRSASDMHFIEKTFPSDISKPIDMERMTRITGVGIVIVTAKNGGTVFNKKVAEEIFSLYDDIYNVSVEWKGKEWNFTSLCSPWWFGQCILNSASEVLRRLNDFNSGKFRPFYPIDTSYNKNIITITSANFGGVETDEDNRIVSAKAIRFFYQLEYRDKEKLQISQLWEEKFFHVIEQKRFENIDVCTFTTASIGRECTYTTLSGLPFGVLSLTVTVGFAILTSLTSDPIKSKPWLGLAAGISAMLGLGSAFGLLFLFGMPYIDIVLCVPFIMIGIGVDDAFVLIASWRRTSSEDSVPDRMAAAYSEAAMSITITSLTNLISFLFGMATPYRQVDIFATFCSLSVFFCYIYQIFFFGACMALSGYREEKQLHCLTFRKVPTRDKKSFTRISNNVEGCEDIAEKEHIYSTTAMKFFRDTFSELLINRYFRILLVLSFILYVTLACIGCVSVVDGPDYRNGFRYESSGWKYFDWNYRYFGDYPHRVQVVIDEELDYFDPKVQAKVEQLTKKFETASFSGEPSMTEHWLRSYKEFLNSSSIGARVILKGYNVSDPQDFYHVLRNVFFKIPVFRLFSSDVVFKSNYTKITQSRFIIQTKGAHSGAVEKKMLEDIYQVVDTTEYKTVAFNAMFRLVEQSIFVKSVTIQTILCAMASMVLVFLIFIPSFRCVILVVFCLVSIEVGVVGFMAFWSVNLDPLSLLGLIMTVGFSVDFAAHVSYSFSASKEATTVGRIRHSMYSAGMPVLQGAGSTTLGVVFLVLTSSNSFLILFKIVFLSMVLASFHSLFLLPIFLGLVSPQRQTSAASRQPARGELKLLS